MRYTNKKILKITFPVLVCLLMEQLIGLTDTAYLGRVGEAEFCLLYTSPSPLDTR